MGRSRSASWTGFHATAAPPSRHKELNAPPRQHRDRRFGWKAPESGKAFPRRRRGVGCGEALVGGFVDVVPIFRRIGHRFGAGVADLLRVGRLLRMHGHKLDPPQRSHNGVKLGHVAELFGLRGPSRSGRAIARRSLIEQRGKCGGVVPAASGHDTSGMAQRGEVGFGILI